MSPVFFFNDTATTEIYTLSLHDALPISSAARSSDRASAALARLPGRTAAWPGPRPPGCPGSRSEEHTSEPQSPCNLVCRLLLEKKKDRGHSPHSPIRYRFHTALRPQPVH